MVVTLFAHNPGIWCIGGGWSLDLFAGTESRPHEAVDVIVARSELGLLHPSFPEWSFVAAHGELTPWDEGDAILARAHDIWCRRADGFFEVQLMVSEFTAIEWIFRRDARIRGPKAEMIVMSAGGLPFLAPEIQLLYKSSPTNRPKDERDFAHALPSLSTVQRQWLAANLELLYGDHP